jgi:hypothetical protein
MINRPNEQKIREAFNEHLTIDIKGYENTIWDLFNWIGIDDVITFLQDYAFPNDQVGVSADYEQLSIATLERSIKEMAEV